MDVIIGICVSVIVCVLICWFVQLVECKFSDELMCILTGSLIMALVVMFVAAIQFHSPTAMDVYNNKTTLEYKVVDGVKVDSVVIFKNNK